MRIIGGALSGRRIPEPKGGSVRPTTDRVREALGSLLEARDAVLGARILDLFAGTGALSFEMLSRGAESAFLVEEDRRVLAECRRSARTLGLTIDTLAFDAFASRPFPRGLVEQAPFSLVFLDPPYARVDELETPLGHLVHQRLLTDEAICVVEHPKKSTPPIPTGLATIGAYRYGDTSILLATPERDSP
ncbi:MAG: 16S rRNA (guanine(966)-N(2))-methyltransferase RsmD [Myxococcota bacterium]